MLTWLFDSRQQNFLFIFVCFAILLVLFVLCNQENIHTTINLNLKVLEGITHLRYWKIVRGVEYNQSSVCILLLWSWSNSKISLHNYHLIEVHKKTDWHLKMVAAVHTIIFYIKLQCYMVSYLNINYNLTFAFCCLSTLVRIDCFSE